MKPIHKCALGMVALLGLTLFAGRAASAAPPMADRVPADATVYFGWAGLDAPASGYNDSKLAKLVEALDLKSTIDDLIQRGLAEDSPVDPDGRKALKVIQDLDGAYLDRPWALYITLPEDLDKVENKPPFMRFMIDPGEDREAITRAMKLIRDQIAKENGKDMVTLQLDGGRSMLSLTIRPELAPAPTTHPERLMDSDAFRAAMGNLKPGSLLTYYLNADGLVEKIVSDPDAPPQAKAIVEQLGLQHLRSLVQTGGFDDQGRFTSRFALRCDGEPALALKLLGGKPLTDREMKLAPKSAVWVRAMRFDAGRLFDEVESLMKRYAPDQARRMDAMLEQVSGKLGQGIDLREDVIHGLGKLVMLYADQSLGAAMVGVNGGAVVPLSKPDRVSAVLAAGLKWIKANQPPNARQQVQFSKSTIQGVEVYAVHSAKVNLALAVDDGKLLITKLGRSIAVMARQRDAADSILDNPAFQKVREAVGVENPTSIVFVDLPRTAPGYYTAIRMMLGMASMGLQSPAFSQAVGMLPSLATLQDQLSPAGWASRITPTGWVSRSIVPFPGATSLSPEVMTTAVGPIGVGVVRPALAQARHTARQAQALSNLRQVGVAMMTYSADHDDELPSSMADALPYLGGEPSLFFYPGHEQALPDHWEAMPPAQAAKWLRLHSSFVYLLSGQSFNGINDPSQRVMLFAKPKFAVKGNQIATVYADGHATMVPRFILGPQLKKQTGKSMEQLIHDAETGEGKAVDAGSTSGSDADSDSGAAPD